MGHTVIAFILVLLSILIFIFGGIGYRECWYSDSLTIFDFYEESTVFFLSTIILIVLSVIIAVLIIKEKVEQNRKKYICLLIFELLFGLLLAILYLILSDTRTGYYAGFSALLVSILTGILLIDSKNIPIVVRLDKSKKDETPSNNADKKISDLEEKIVKLEEMKNKGLINEEEFNRIKSRYLDEYCK